MEKKASRRGLSEILSTLIIAVLIIVIAITVLLAQRQQDLTNFLYSRFGYAEAPVGGGQR